MSRPIAIVTGVGRAVGIGAGIARRLSADGWDLALTWWTAYDDRMPWGVQPDDVVELRNTLVTSGARVALVEADLTDTGAAAAIFDATERELGPASALVMSHAESVDSGILDTSIESFDKHFAVNTRASWLLIREFATRFDLARGTGRIVALTSDHTAFNLPYGASKGALDRIVIAAARELADRGISANVVNPGPIDTGWMTPELAAQLAEATPGGRLGTPSQTAALVSFLLGPDGAWINGQLLKSDGGFSS